MCCYTSTWQQGWPPLFPSVLAAVRRSPFVPEPPGTGDTPVAPVLPEGPHHGQGLQVPAARLRRQRMKDYGDQFGEKGDFSPSVHPQGSISS